MRAINRLERKSVEWATQHTSSCQNLPMTGSSNYFPQRKAKHAAAAVSCVHDPDCAPSPAKTQHAAPRNSATVLAILSPRLILGLVVAALAPRSLLLSVFPSKPPVSPLFSRFLGTMSI